MVWWAVAPLYRRSHDQHKTSVYVGPDETITALTDDGIEELTDLIKAARLTTRTWHEFLDDFVDDKDLVLRIKAKLPR
jgi:hypothetical protein